MYKITFIFLCLMSLSLYGESEYLLCIDGGGSKTILQIINQEGLTVKLNKNGLQNDKIETSGSNINLIGPEGVRNVLSNLLDGLIIVEGNKEIDFKSILPTCRIIAGMSGAGTGLSQNKESLISLMQEWGFNKDHVLVMSDAEMVLELIDGNGIILIAGTGSICFGENNGTLFRVGGLGKVLGDEGSGYQIGLHALKAALSEEYGWGISTSLTASLKEKFQVSELKTLIPMINRGEMTTSKIASSAPLVFKAMEDDDVAKEIIDRAATDISTLLSKMCTISSLSDCEVHLWGGIFKNDYANVFIQKIREKLPESYKNLKMINKSQENPAVLFARQFIK